ncbi:MAG: EVE domain-containing protein [Chloroflexota bacterium]
MMGDKTYWLDLFTWRTWQEFLKAGGEVSGFREQRWNTVQQIKEGDYLLCYLTGASRWIGILEVTAPAYMDRSPIWNEDAYPCRVKVNVIARLTPETAVPIMEIRDQLTIFRNQKSAVAWTGWLRSSPRKWKDADGEVVVNAIREAECNPMIRPVEPARLNYTANVVKSKMGPVTVPDREESEAEQPDSGTEPRSHAEIQLLLSNLGSDMGFDVWVARNDRNREVGGRRFADLPRMKKDLQLHFDEATNRTIELIDVLWLRGQSIVAAFEIESTTSVYSGLLRMSDLIAMQPNLNIPLYLVAPDERRQKVLAEVNRPTFSRLSPPIKRVCRYISFSALREQIAQVGPFVKYLKPDFLEDLSEACEIDNA